MAHRFFITFVSLTLVAILVLAGVTPAQAARPSNDDIASATIITGSLPFTERIDTTEATSASDDPDCFGSGHTVWYQFTPIQSMELTITTFGSDYDTTLAVYTGVPGSLLQEICKDYPTMPYLYQAALHLDAVANQTYYIMVGAIEAGGTLVFNIEPYHPVSVDIQINPVLSFDKDGNAIVRATITCPDPTLIDWIEGRIEQKAGRRVIEGKFSVTMEAVCWGEQEWQTLAIAENGRFRGGSAAVTLHGLVFDIVTWWGVDMEAAAAVRLKGKK